MAEEQIVYDVIIDTSAMLRQAAVTKQTIDDLKAKQKELDTTTEAGRIENEKLAASLRELQKQYKGTQKDIDNTTKVLTAETGSIEANRAALSKLTAEYIKIGKPTAEQTKRLNDLSATLKKQEAAIGDTRRNVGNYASALSGLTSTIPGASGAMEVFNAVIEANPIGLLTVAVGGLIALFKDYEPAADKAAEASSALGNAMDVLRQRIAKSSDSFGDFVVGLLTFDSEKFQSGILGITKSFEGIGEEMDKAATAGLQYAHAVDAINDANKRLEVSNAKQEKDIAILRKQLKDRTLDDSKRLEIADEIAKKETDRFEKEKFLLDLTVLNERKALEGALERAGVSRLEIDQTQDLLKLAQERNIGEKERNRFADAQIKLINKQTESETLLEKVNVDKNRLLDEIATKQAKAAADELKRQQDLLKQAEENRRKVEQARKDEIDAQEKNTNEFFDRQKIALQDQYSQGLINAQAYNDGLLQIEKDRRLRQLQDQKDYNEKTIETEKELSDARVAQKEAEDKLLAGLLAEAQKEAEDNTKHDEDLKKKQLSAQNEFVDSFLNLTNSVGMATKKGAQTAKAVAIAELAFSSGAAIGKATDSAAPLPFPGNIFAIATAVATVLANIARATAIINSAPKFYKGGFTGEGDPTEESLAIGPKPYIYHKQEYVVDHKTLAHPYVSELIRTVVEPLRRGNKPMGLPGFADGGFATTSIRNEVNAQISNDRLLGAIANMKIGVSVDEINTKQTRVKVLESKATL